MNIEFILINYIINYINIMKNIKKIINSKMKSFNEFQEFIAERKIRDFESRFSSKYSKY